jgi:acid phosphatase family membrane protein YuiD
VQSPFYFLVPRSHDNPIFASQVGVRSSYSEKVQELTAGVGRQEEGLCSTRFQIEDFRAIFTKIFTSFHSYAGE